MYLGVCILSLVPNLPLFFPNIEAISLSLLCYNAFRCALSFFPMSKFSFSFATILLLSLSKGYLFFSLPSIQALWTLNSFLLSHVSIIQIWIKILFSSFNLNSPKLHPFTIYLFFLALPHILLQPPTPHILSQLVAYSSMGGWGNLARTWPFASILTFALVLTSDYVVVEMSKLMPMYPNWCAL